MFVYLAKSHFVFEDVMIGDCHNGMLQTGHPRVSYDKHIDGLIEVLQQVLAHVLPLERRVVVVQDFWWRCRPSQRCRDCCCCRRPPLSQPGPRGSAAATRTRARSRSSGSPWLARCGSPQTAAPAGHGCTAAVVASPPPLLLHRRSPDRRPSSRSGSPAAFCLENLMHHHRHRPHHHHDCCCCCCCCYCCPLATCSMQ